MVERRYTAIRMIAQLTMAASAQAAALMVPAVMATARVPDQLPVPAVARSLPGNPGSCIKKRAFIKSNNNLTKLYGQGDTLPVFHF
jgi:hypothetical protein